MAKPILTDTTLLRRKPDLSGAQKDGQFVMLDVKSGAYFAMDAVGGTVWEALAEPMSFADLVDLIVASFSDAERSKVRADLLEFIPQLHESDLIEMVTAK